MNIITENRHNEYGCLMALPPIEYCYKMIDLAKKIIPVNNLYIDSDDSNIIGFVVTPLDGATASVNFAFTWREVY
jgi:hypothetical protein